MKIPCYICQKEMIIDEINGEAYCTDGLIIQFDENSIPISIDDTNKKIRHELCIESIEE